MGYPTLPEVYRECLAPGMAGVGWAAQLYCVVNFGQSSSRSRSSRVDNDFISFRCQKNFPGLDSGSWWTRKEILSMLWFLCRNMPPLGAEACNANHGLMSARAAPPRSVPRQSQILGANSPIPQTWLACGVFAKKFQSLEPLLRGIESSRVDARSSSITTQSTGGAC
jgi:hypothetical protein